MEKGGPPASTASTAQEPFPNAPYPEQMQLPPPTYEQATGVTSAPYQQPLGFHPPPPQQITPSVIQIHQYPNSSQANVYQPTASHLPPPQQNLPMQYIQNTILLQTPVGINSTQTACPHCLKSIRTRVSYDSAARTHLIALFLCLFCFPCCFLPYCINACKDINHYCPNCESYLGTYDYYNHRRY